MLVVVISDDGAVVVVVVVGDDGVDVDMYESLLTVTHHLEILSWVFRFCHGRSVSAYIILTWKFVVLFLSKPACICY